ncbi:hypothetical protein LTQ56_17650 [Mycobacterium intracellulare subsp. intracellulare]|uniref:hypothetical protein n=1 Tax=Mycobacterium intracellulare TaxID=1767 RepID=UPI000493FB5F|nr:hypothetical protein [Mycobacterium intracellulare]UGU05760.1 hypothetical protein LTQ56_17650 [Mycobacterium intracellulare subsp. intracellulare]BCO59616.1 hypothetical protein MINTM005_48600 [Mycobacterium intracellulare]BCO96796.1 hypothetical protein MINTM016_47720 [Mycobacterium intracellulare]
MSVNDLPRPNFSRQSDSAGDRLEWWQGDKMPHCITARRQTMSDGTDTWVATRVGLYVSKEALRQKHDEILDTYPEARVIRFEVSEFDWVLRAEKKGRRIL